MEEFNRESEQRLPSSREDLRRVKHRAVSQEERLGMAIKVQQFEFKLLTKLYQLRFIRGIEQPAYSCYMELSDDEVTILKNHGTAKEGIDDCWNFDLGANRIVEVTRAANRNPAGKTNFECAVTPEVMEGISKWGKTWEKIIGLRAH